MYVSVCAYKAVYTCATLLGTSFSLFSFPQIYSAKNLMIAQGWRSLSVATTAWAACHVSKILWLAFRAAKVASKD